MYELLIKAARTNVTLDMIYMAKDGKISKRRITVQYVGNSVFTAHCYLRGTKRTFIINNILALVPVVHNEKEVVSF